MAKEKELPKGLWDKVNEESFTDEKNIETVDVGEYNKDEMGYFAFNINCARQLPALEDSLIPVQRRVMWVAYLMKAYQKRKVKCATLAGQTMNYHPHADSSIYSTIVNMAQPFKKGAPLFKGIGNFGTIIDPVNVGAPRYTETYISDYAYECFFDDLDQDCMEMVPNAVRDAMEPVYLPTKFPNILIEGVSGIGIGFNAVIPPFNINDVIKLTKRLIVDPADPDIIIYPDPPCDGCDIVMTDDLRTICEDGSGSLAMRAHIDVENAGQNFIFPIRSVPWLVALSDVEAKIADLCAKGDLKFKDMADYSRPLLKKKSDDFQKHEIDIRLTLNKAYDPLKELDKLYKLTELQKSFSVRFWAVHEGIKVDKFNIRSLTLGWIDTRREYLRRLLNKKITKINARLTLLSVLIRLTEKTNLEKTISTIKKASSEKVEDSLMREYGITSYLAHRIIDMPLRAFTLDMHQKYADEYDGLEKELKHIMKLIQSEKNIDELILEDLDELKKYAPAHRYCNLVELSGSSNISDTEHIVVFSHAGYYKKLPIELDSRVKGYGQFVRGDYPVQAIKCRNLENLIIYDTTGRFSIVPVHELESTTPSETGTLTRLVAKLTGEIVGVDFAESKTDEEYTERLTGLSTYVVTLSKFGFLKKTPMREFRDLRGSKAIKCAKLANQDDSIIDCQRLLCENPDKKAKVSAKQPPDLMIYTKRGNFTIVPNASISITGREAQGSACMNLDGGEYVQGMCILPPTASHVVVITDKGYIKILETKAFGDLSRHKAKTYLLSGEGAGDVIMVRPIKENDAVSLYVKNECIKFAFSDIPILSRFSKGKNLLPSGNDIILHVDVQQGE